MTAMRDNDAVDAERCATCRAFLVARSPSSPAVRYCETCWWVVQRDRLDDGRAVDPLARARLARPGIVDAYCPDCGHRHLVDNELLTNAGYVCVRCAGHLHGAGCQAPPPDRQPPAT